MFLANNSAALQHNRVIQGKVELMEVRSGRRSFAQRDGIVEEIVKKLEELRVPKIGAKVEGV